jgi:hypothetical protein
MKKFTLTDPDNKQYGRQLSPTKFEFKEKDRFDDGEIEMIIDLEAYSDKEKESHISAYYSSLQEVKEIYGDEANWIIAECIFEQESGQY